MQKHKWTNQYHWIVEEFKTHEKKDEDFINRIYFYNVEDITKQYNCSRMSFYYYFNGTTKRNKKLGHLKICRTNIPRRINIDNPDII